MTLTLTVGASKRIRATVFASKLHNWA